MNKYTEKLLLLLAASDIPPANIRAAIRDLQSMSQEELASLILDIRSLVLSDYVDRSNRNRTQPEYPPESYQGWDVENSEVARQVERLLKFEAGLTLTDASRLLKQRLKRRPELIGADIYEPGPKESYRRWAARLLRSVPPNILLQEATRLRNEAVHRPDVDWPLKNRE